MSVIKFLETVLQNMRFASSAVAAIDIGKSME
jgi:hypothetical protein